MVDISDGEVVAEGRDDENHGCKKHGREHHDTGTAGGLAETVPVRIVFEYEREEPDSERIDAQRQGEEQGETADLCHVEEPQVIFSESGGGGNRDSSEIGSR